MIAKSANGGLFRLSVVDEGIVIQPVRVVFPAVLTVDENGNRYASVIAPYSSGLYDRAACAWNAVELPRVHIEYSLHAKVGRSSRNGG